MAKVKENNILKKYFVGVCVKYCVIKNVAVNITVNKKQIFKTLQLFMEVPT